jgi:hypothetical protein
MNEKTSSTKNIIKYLREISVVVIGVAITLSASYWITHKNEKRDLKLYLSAVQLEIYGNKGMIEDRLEILQNSLNYAAYLRSHDKKSLNKDSIKSYYPEREYYNFSSFAYKKDAFEMFKISGSMRLIKDKYLLADLWNIYSDLEELKYGIGLMLQSKAETVKQEIYMSKEADFIPLYDYYTKNDVTSIIWQSYTKQQEMLEKMLERLEKFNK